MPDWTVAIAILFFLWVLSAVAQPQGQSRSRESRSRKVEKSKAPDFSTPRLLDASTPARLSRKRREEIKQRLSGYDRIPLQGTDEHGDWKWSSP
jgi:hypothetical protein